jgi:hypothetical protein
VSRLGRTWDRWVRFWDRRERGTTLALWRIACGLCVVGAIGAVVLAGAARPLWFDPADGGYSPRTAPWQFRLLGGVTPGVVNGVVAATVIAGVLMTIGLGGRLPVLVALQGYLALVNLNGAGTGGYDFAIANSLWLLILARGTETLSLDCRIRSGRWTSEREIPAWPRYLAIFQLVLIYWSTGMHKLSAAWTPAGGFSALYYILQQPTWRRFDTTWAAYVYPLTQVATAVTWAWEVTSPLLLLALWYRATAGRPGRVRRLFNRVNFRRLFVLIGLTVHLGLLVLMEVGPFSLVMLAFYLCLYHPDEWRKAKGAHP